MEEKKWINPNMGILVVLLFAAVCTLVDYIIINKALRKYESNSDTTVDKGNSIINNDILSEEKALVIGKDIFYTISDYYLHYGPIEQGVDYVKNDDGSFSVLNDSDSLIKYKKLDIDKLSLIASSEYIKTYCSDSIFDEYNGDYYRPEGGRGSNISYIDTELKVVSIEKDALVFDAISSYFADDSERINGVSYESAKKEYKTNTFKLIYESGTWKVSKFTRAY